VLKEQFEASLDLPDVKGFVYWPNPTSFVWLTYYYGSLYVVIEAWQDLKLQSPLIDFLLEHQKGIISVMRRFRNMTFHFQRELENPKYVEFLKLGGKQVLLVELLHESFVRYYLEWLENLPGTEAQQEEQRALVAKFVGWIPHTIKDDVREMKAELERFELAFPYDALAGERRARAMEIKIAMEEFPKIAHSSKAGLESLRERMIRQLFDSDVIDFLDDSQRTQ
jgi:hypothetical protein